MPLNVQQEYLSIGGNRQTAACAWHAPSGCLAFGADHNIALWQPLDERQKGIHRLIKGHKDRVTAVAIVDGPEPLLVSGAANGDLSVQYLEGPATPDHVLRRSKAHDGSVNVIAALKGSSFLISGGADAVVKVWKHTAASIDLITTIKPTPRLIPLALAVGTLPDVAPEHGFFFVVAGTRNHISVYSVRDLGGSFSAHLACTLTGHEGWIRSLSIRKTNDSGYMLASTSADKYVRLWRFQTEVQSLAQKDAVAKEANTVDQTLTARIKTVGIEEKKFAITFEALLLGHEDWVYSADWQDTAEAKLLTASADGTLAIWESDPTSGIWISETRLGEISGQKGATTATGSSGGFWAGRWVSDEQSTAVVSLGRTGSWRIWHFDERSSFWDLKPGIGGHIDAVNGLCWSPNGEYLLSTSSDQTTRLHAEWRRSKNKTWHEFSRCQIHGYDCNVVTCVSTHQFVSGADEKLLRVFNEPKELADTLLRLCEIERPTSAQLPESAAIPVLGLSNKEMGEPDDIIEAGPRRGEDDYAIASALAGISLVGITEPPTEDLLSRHTLWPEHEKLYGHGYEISECAYSNGILATACKASSVDYATIRLYDPNNNWRQIEPPLSAHALTVTRLAWSYSPERYLLSVGRDRQWTLFQRDETNSKELKLFQAMPKAHTRMILDAAFSSTGAYPFFATAGRDKSIKLWGHVFMYDNENAKGLDHQQKAEFKLYRTITRPSPVTAIALTCNGAESHGVLAAGEEDGSISIHIFDIETLQVEDAFELSTDVCPPRAVNRLQWRLGGWNWHRKDGCAYQLAVAGADGSVRILTVDLSSHFQEILVTNDMGKDR